MAISPECMAGCDRIEWSGQAGICNDTVKYGLMINSILIMFPKQLGNFIYGGYQPAQKWLKDRKGRVLGFDNVRHYHKIIKALVETDKIMQEIDAITEI